MVRLEHVNLVVKDLEQTKHFLLSAFPEWRVRGSGASVWYGRKRNWCHIGDDGDYITLNDSAIGDNRDLKGHAPGLAHIGFEVDDCEAVCKRLEAAGYAITTEGAVHPYRKTVYFIDDEGFEFEFMQYTSAHPEERNQYGGELRGIIRHA